MTEPYYIVEVIREADKKAFMLVGYPSSDPEDTWCFDNRQPILGHDPYWAKLKTLTQFHEHTDHNKWLCDFVLPEMKKMVGWWPVKEPFMVGRTNPHTMTIYRVDMNVSLNLRYKPMVCKTFHLSGEPFIGAIKQGYFNEQ